MLERRGALAELKSADGMAVAAHADATLRLQEIQPAAAWLIVGWDSTIEAHARAAVDALGLPGGDPPGPLEAASDAHSLVAWLGPRRWLAITNDGVRGAGLCAAVPPEHRVEWRCARSWLQLSGAAAQSLLDGELPVDLRPSVFPDGAATQTVLGEVDMLVHARTRAPVPAFDLLPGRSFAAHLARDLGHAAALEGLALRVAPAGGTADNSD